MQIDGEKIDGLKTPGEMLHDVLLFIRVATVFPGLQLMSLVPCLFVWPFWDQILSGSWLALIAPPVCLLMWAAYYVAGLEVVRRIRTDPYGEMFSVYRERIQKSIFGGGIWIGVIGLGPVFSLIALFVGDLIRVDKDVLLPCLFPHILLFSILLVELFLRCRIAMRWRRLRRLGLVRFPSEVNMSVVQKVIAVDLGYRTEIWLLEKCHPDYVKTNPMGIPEHGVVVDCKNGFPADWKERVETYDYDYGYPDGIAREASPREEMPKFW